MQNRWRLGVVALCWAFACSNSDRPGLIGATGGTRTGPTPAVGGDDSGSGAASSVGGATGEAGDAGDAPGAGDGGAEAGGAAQGGGAGTADGGEPIIVEPLPEPTCVGDGELRDATKLAISTADADQFGSVTPDELVIAWTVVDGASVTLHYARRASANDDFGSVSTLELEDAADDSVTLSADGLRVVYVNADRKGFTQLVRAARDEPFADVDNRDFVPIAESAQDFAEDELVGDPVLGPDDSTFFYSRYGAKRSATLLGTLRFSLVAPWPAGTELPVAPSLKAVDDERLRPTAVSLDRQTVFLWNAVSELQTVALLSHDTSSYEPAFELDDARGAAPNAACSRVYFDRDGDLWTAELR